MKSSSRAHSRLQASKSSCSIHVSTSGTTDSSCRIPRANADPPPPPRARNVYLFRTNAPNVVEHYCRIPPAVCTIGERQAGRWQVRASRGRGARHSSHLVQLHPVQLAGLRVRPACRRACQEVRGEVLQGEATSLTTYTAVVPLTTPCFFM